MNKEMKIRNLILSINESFTISDVVSLLKNNNLFDKNLIRKILIDFCDSGVLRHIGNLFYVEREVILGSII